MRVLTVPGGSEGVTVKSVGLVEKIGYDCFDKFDYVHLDIYIRHRESEGMR